MSAVENFLMRCLATPLAPSGRRSRLLILTYHRLLRVPDPLLPDDVDAATFAWQLELLKAQFRVLSLPEAVQRLHAGTLPARVACITFDDGYANNAEVALPLLQRFDMPATFFVSVGFLDGGCMWNDAVIEAVRGTPHAVLELEDLGLGRCATASLADKSAGAAQLLAAIKYLDAGARRETVSELVRRAQAPVPTDLMMSSAQVRELARAGMEMGAHTVSHPILARLDAGEAEREILVGRDRLREITGVDVRVFAYPNGVPGRDYTAVHVAMARRAGFSAAVSTAWGFADATTDRWQLPRIAPWDRTRMRFSLRMLRAYFEQPTLVAPEGATLRPAV